MLYNSGKPDAGLASFLKAAQLKPNLAEAHYNAGQIYQEKGEKDNAIKHFKAAVAANPKYEAAVLALSKLAGATGGAK